MTISKFSFEIGYKKLEAAFGTAVNRRRMDAYFGELSDLLTEGSWDIIVRKVARTASAFPKLHELLELAGPTEKKEPRLSDTFVDDDCKVVECVEGVISYMLGENTVASRCPRCSRGPGGLPRYTGSVTLRTEEEMIARRQERADIVRDQRMARRKSTVIDETAEELF